MKLLLVTLQSYLSVSNEHFTPPLPYSVGASFPPAYQGRVFRG